MHTGLKAPEPTLHSTNSEQTDVETVPGVESDIYRVPARDLPAKHHNLAQQLLPEHRWVTLTSCDQAGSLLWSWWWGGGCINPGHAMTLTLLCLPSPHLKLPKGKAWVCLVCCYIPGALNRARHTAGARYLLTLTESYSVLDATLNTSQASCH